MNKGLIISIISGLSTLFGIIFTINIKNSKKIDKIVTISLSIAFIYMILVSLFDLFPNSLKNMQNKAFLDVFLYIMVNYTIIQIILKITHKYTKNKVEKGKLYFLGLINMFTLLNHNIPEGISIAVPIYFSTKSRSRAIGYTFIAAIGEIIGSIIALLFIKNRVNYNLIGFTMISISVVMITIAVEEIFFQIKDKNKKNIAVGLSIGLIIFLINMIFN